MKSVQTANSNVAARHSVNKKTAEAVFLLFVEHALVSCHLP